MKLKKNVALIGLLLFVTIGFTQLQKLSPLSKASILTVGIGDDLASTFGHSAIRIKDPAIGLDIVYGYGTFDFYASNFYLKFARGKLNYTISKIPFSYFIEEYKQENRWVKEQSLDVRLAEKNQLFLFLENNYLPENRNYKYDFLYDNCATKIWDVLKKVYKNDLILDKNYLEKQYSFRELLSQHLQTNSWSSFGINLALGSVIDAKATPKEHMFLPIYVFDQLNYSRLNGKPLVNRTTTLLGSKQRKNSSFFFSPLFLLLVISICIIGTTFLNFKNKKRSNYLDFVLFLSTGTTGIVVLLLWLATEHTATAVNYNFLWVFPLNTILSFYLIRKKNIPKWINNYLFILLAFITLTIVLWVFKIQVFSPLIIPLLIAFAIRYIFLINYFRITRD